MRRPAIALLLAVAALVPGAAGADDGCTMIFSAYPGEIDALLTAATLDEPVYADGHTFFPGTLDGNAVVLGLSGIGLVNADAAARAALDAFACIDAIVFSGVAGGRTTIGDVIIPERWTIDDGVSFIDVDPAMFAVAGSIDVPLTPSVPGGDIACMGVDPRAATVVELPHTPQIHAGGDGKSVDPFGGRAFPCIPGGGDVFGCTPCRGPLVAPDVERFIARAVPFIDPAFFLGYFDQPPPSATEWAAEDMETAAVARVADEAGIPFIAFRGVSDGMGDPLNLPGFPFQFFVYRQIAADNAAAVARAFLAQLD